MFTIDFRNRVQNWILQLASSDQCIVSGAVVGSLALDEGDRWSDLDLTFGVQNGTPITEVLEDWTEKIVKEFDAVQLFDLPVGDSIYRVFLLPGCLQFDLSFTPASQFGAAGPKFRLVFGKAVERPFVKPPAARELFGYAVHHILRARFCIERGRYWQAEYWISSGRDYVLSLACVNRGLVASQGRGFDQLPAEIQELLANGLVTSFEREELLRALSCVVEGLLQVAKETHDTREAADTISLQLKQLALPWETD